jgi:hypothetical protein
MSLTILRALLIVVNITLTVLAVAGIVISRNLFFRAPIELWLSVAGIAFSATGLALSLGGEATVRVLSRAIIRFWKGRDYANDHRPTRPLAIKFLAFRRGIRQPAPERESASR